MDREKDDFPPFSLEEAEKWLHKLEDIATIERDSGYATRIILGNLIMALAKSKVIDGRAFLNSIKNQMDQIDGENYKIATKVLLEELLALVNEPDAIGHNGKKTFN